MVQFRCNALLKGLAHKTIRGWKVSISVVGLYKLIKKWIRSSNPVAVHTLSNSAENAKLMLLTERGISVGLKEESSSACILKQPK